MKKKVTITIEADIDENGIGVGHNITTDTGDEGVPHEVLGILEIAKSQMLISSFGNQNLH